MEAIPRGLVSRDMIKALPGIKSLRTSILPANSSGNHSYTSTASNKITIQVPSFPNSFINTKRSFLRFVYLSNVIRNTKTLFLGMAPIFSFP